MKRESSRRNSLVLSQGWGKETSNGQIGFFFSLSILSWHKYQATQWQWWQRRLHGENLPVTPKRWGKLHCTEVHSRVKELKPLISGW